MKRYAKVMLSAATVVGGMMAAGCHHGSGGGDSNWHGDPCWPDRYANEARAATVASFQPQVENGHILDQTIWNIHFEFGTDKLNGAGMDKLDQLSRRRPMPDQHLYLQTARDINYDAEKPAEYAAKRVELDNKRTEAVRKYLKASLTGRDVIFDIQVHDPAPPGIESVAPGRVPASRPVAPQPGGPITVNQGANAGSNQGVVAPGSYRP